MRSFNLVQITDCHLGSQPGDSLLGLDTDQSLCDVLNMIQSLETPDLLLTTGDISNDAGAQSYERFVEFLRKYFPNLPLAWLPGNHDEPLNMDQVSEPLIEAHYVADGWNLIFLDSRIPMEEGGELSSFELERLERELRIYYDLPTMIFLHHQPVPVGSKWLDQYVLKNADDFFKVVDKYQKNVKAISWGHVHQEFESDRNGIKLIATPSTCIQFTPKSDEFSVDHTMPGYRTYRLYENGTFATQVERVPDKAYAINFASTGY